MYVLKQKVLAGLVLGTLGFSALSAYAIDATKISWGLINHPAENRMVGATATSAIKPFQFDTGNGTFTIDPIINMPAGEVVKLPLLPTNYFWVDPVVAGKLGAFFNYDGTLSGKLGTGVSAVANLVPTSTGQVILWDIRELGIDPDGWVVAGKILPGTFNIMYDQPDAYEDYVLVRMKDGTVKSWSRSMNRADIEALSLKQIQTRKQA